MADLTLKKQRISEKNGMVTYKADNRRTTGSVYFDRKMFPAGQAPETLVVSADNIVIPEPPAPKAAADVSTEQPAGASA